MEEAAAGLAAIMKDLAGVRDDVEQDMQQKQAKIKVGGIGGGVERGTR